jgi:hypothetical protein
VAVRFYNIAIDLVMETKVGGRDSNGGNRPKPSNTVNLSAALSLCVASSSQANQDTPPGQLPASLTRVDGIKRVGSPLQS